MLQSSRNRFLRRLGGESKTRALGVENNVLALQEDVTEDGHANTLVGLETTEAGTVTGRGVVDQASGNGGGVAADNNSEVGQLRVAGEGVSTGFLVILGTRDTLVVSRDNLLVDEQERGAGVLPTVRTCSQKSIDQERWSTHQQYR